MRSPIYLAKKSIAVLKTEGFKAFLFRVRVFILFRIRKRNDLLENYIVLHEINDDELKRQKEESETFGYKPFFSICVPLYKTKPEYLIALLDSIREQSYEHFEICLADAGRGDGSDDLEAVVDKYKADYPDCKIVYKALEKNYGIADNTNAAIEISSGDVIVFCDHDDTIAPMSLYEFAKAMNDNPDVDVIYSDQDFITADGKIRTEPLWKPEFSIDFLRCSNYISHLFGVKKELLDKVGYLDGDFDGSQDYDLTLRLCEQAKAIHHVPKLLYHWRIISTSTSMAPESKSYAYENGKRALDAHFKRVGLPAHAEFTSYTGKYRTVYEWKEEPLVSVLIPNKDHIGELKVCVESLETLSDYRNFEIVIIENNSTEEKTFDYYNELEAKYDNVRVIYYEGGFNYAAINNFGVREAKGDYLLLLNNDTKMYDGQLIREMLGYIMRSDVGVVGAKLFYEDGTIQHCGVIIGYGGTAGHAFLGQPHNGVGNIGRIVSVVNYSAVTGACLMTKREVFDKVGGLTEELAVAFNDVDYCLKARQEGYLVVYTPFAKAWHFESKSRGYEDTPEKMERFLKESEIFKTRWKDFLEKGDPYYNPNLTTEQADFSLKREHEWQRKEG